MTKVICKIEDQQTFRPWIEIRRQPPVNIFSGLFGKGHFYSPKFPVVTTFQKFVTFSDTVSCLHIR